MGHKVNPDIFRLGVSKTWSFQLRTNKNFLKNLYLFKFLRNLFMNYTIPVFNFNKRRNQKINDKLILRGEEQLIPSPFIKNNLLFSHVCFGLIKNHIFIESFFIDVSIKQQRRKKENIKRNYFLDIYDYKPWNAMFYRTSVFGRLNRLKVKSHEKLRKIFVNRILRIFGKRSNHLRLKPSIRLSKDLHKLLKSFNPKHNKFLKSYLSLKFKSYVKKSKNRFKPISVRIFKQNLNKENKQSYYLTRKNFFLSKFKKKHLKREKSIDSVNFLKDKMLFVNNLFFYKKSFNRVVRNIKNRFSFRYLRKHRYRRSKKSYSLRHKNYFYYQITLPKLLNLISKHYYSAFEFSASKKGLPKTPFVFYDVTFSNPKNYVFYNIFHNLKLLKYFIRVAKFVQYFPLKKKIFFSQSLIALLMNFFGMLNTSVLVKKMYLLLQTMIFYTLSFSFYNFVNFKKLFFSKFVFFKGVSKTIYRSVINLANVKKLSFFVVGQNKFRFNSSLVLNYILIKLGQYFSIHEIVNPLSFYIKGLTSIAGYKILITGRLTRKERAAVMVRSGKKMPLSTIKANIDYSAGFKIMKFGLVGIKVYLLLNPSTLINLYRFKYFFDAKVS